MSFHALPNLPIDIRIAIDALIIAARKAERHQRTPRPDDAGDTSYAALVAARRQLETLIREELK